MKTKEIEIVPKIEGIGPKYGRKFTKIGIKTLDDLRGMNINKVYRKTGISKKKLMKWQAMAVLQEVRGIDRQISEVLVKGGITDLRKLAREKPKKILRMIKDAREPREAYNIIPDDYDRVITLADVRKWQREARIMISPPVTPEVPSAEEMYGQVEILFDSGEKVFPTRFMFRVTELDDYFVYEYWLYYPKDYSPLLPGGGHKHDLEGFYIFFNKQPREPTLSAITCHWELRLRRNPPETIKLYAERGKHAFHFEKKSSIFKRANGEKKANLPWSYFVPLKSEKTFLDGITGDAKKWRVSPLINNSAIYKKILKEAEKGYEVVHVPADCKLHKKCVEWEKKLRCEKWEIKRKKKCKEKKDKGYKKCCKWWPCSWACKAWVWVSNIVCVAWTWITTKICKGWRWIKTNVCKFFVWVSKGC